MYGVPLIAEGWLTLGSWVCVRNQALRPGANCLLSVSDPIKWFWIEEEWKKVIYGLRSNPHKMVLDRGRVKKGNLWLEEKSSLLSA